MKIIALQGKSNTGKTRTLKILIEKMRTAKHKLINEKIGKSDDWAVFEVGDKIVGISTKGDSDACINNHLAEIIENIDALDVFICAAHTYGKTEDFVKTKSIGDYILCGKSTFISSNNALMSSEQEKQNEWQADYLLSLI